MSAEEATSTSRDIHVRVGLPLPMGVAGTIMKLMGTVYPDCKIGNGGNEYIDFIISSDAIPQEIPEDFTHEPHSEGTVTELGPGGISVGGTKNQDTGKMEPHSFAKWCLITMKESFGDFPEETNYLEQQCYDPETKKNFVMTFQKADKKTPHQLRQEAEAEAAALRAKVAQLENLVAKLVKAVPTKP